MRAAPAPLWTNGDFESDAIGAVPSGWTVSPQQNRNIIDTRPNPQTYTSLDLRTGGSANTYIIGGTAESQSDPNLTSAASFRYPRYGSRAAVLNYSAANVGTNYNANVMRQTMTAQNGDIDPIDGIVHVRFVVAPVLENPNHPYEQQPYYYVELKNITRGTTLYQDFNTSAQTGVPWKIQGGYYYTDWQLVDIAPGSAALAVGDQVELTLVAAGCSQSGHWGRLYVDGVGSTVPGLYTWATGPQLVNAGGDITYTVNYRNGGASSTSATSLSFVTPPGTVFRSVSLGSPTCTAPAVDATGTVTCSLGTLAAGSSGSYTVTVRVPTSATVGTVVTAGNYSITATGISPLLGPKVNTTVTAALQANVSITNTDNASAIAWGAATTYVITVTNAGPNPATNVTVTDNFPAQLTNITWTCAGTNGGTCTASGTGNINTVANLPVGGVATYTVSANIVAGTGTGSVSNTATATVGGTVVDPDTSNNSVADTTAIGTPRTLTVTKTSPLGGSVISSPAAINCGPSCTTQSATFIQGSTVILTASAVPNGSFLLWGGACLLQLTPTCTLTITGDTNVTASFIAPVTITANAGSPQSAVISTMYTTQLQAKVVDGNGNPVNGATVTFTPPSSGPSVTLNSTTATTNAMGLASVTATANTLAGTFNVSATVVGGGSPATFTLTNTPGASASVAAFSGTPQSTVINTQFTTALAVVVRDASNNPAPGRTVTFTLPAGAANATLSSATAVTDASGVASVLATANSVVGTYNVTATTGALPAASFALTNTVGAAASVAVNAGSPQTTVVNTAFGTALSVIVRDAGGNPRSGVSVTFAVPGSGASSTLNLTTVTTNASGIATVNATANTVAGSYSVTATAAGVATPATFSLTNTPGAATAMTINGGNSQSTVINTAFTTPLSVRIVDTYGNVRVGDSVAFAAPTSGASAGIVTSPATTNASGIATVNATANATAGSYSVTATSGSLTPLTFALTNTVGAAAAVAVNGGGTQSTVVNTAFGTPLSVLVTDAGGNPRSGVSVTFAVPGSGASAALNLTTVTTNASGIASVNATANTVAGSYSVTATAAGVATPATFSLTNTPGAATAMTINGGNNQTTAVNAAFGTPLSVRIVDTYGNVRVGDSVSFAAPTSGASAGIVSSPATTNAAGIATVNATANATAGSYSVTASSGSLTPVTFSLANTPGAAASVAVNGGGSQSTVISTAFTTPLSVIVRDASNNPKSGVVVTFTSPSTGASTSVTSTTVTTDASGIASLPVTANSVAGAYSVTASVAGVATPATFSLTNTPGAAASVAVNGGGTQSTVVSTAFTTPLSVIVRDASNNPKSGVVVTFTSPSTGASTTATTTTVTTDASGIASLPVTANTVAGAYNVTASVAGVATPATFSLTNTPGAAASVVANGGTPQTTVVSTPFGSALSVIVRDASSNPKSGVVVTFTSPSTGASTSVTTATATTNASGIATLSVSANATAGSYSVSASVPGVATPATFALTNTPGAAASVAVNGGGTQSTVVSTAFTTPLSVIVRDASNNPKSGVVVTFTSPSTGASTTATTTTVTTDASGIASLPVTANSVAGAYNVTASVAGVATPATFALTNTPGAAASVAVNGGSPQTTVVSTAFTTPLSVVVKDAAGNVKGGVVVTFTSPSTGASTSATTATATTNASGIATLPVTANSVAGSYSVSASVVGVTTPATFALTNTPGAAASVAVNGGGTQTTVVNTAFTTPLSVVVKDAAGNVKSGVVVTFTMPTSGASTSVTTATATTDAAGIASLPVTANTVAGAFTATASVVGVTTPASFSLTNTPGAATSMVIASGGTQSAPVTTAFANALAVRVADQYGNVISGKSVTFTAPAGNASASLDATTVTTNVSGIASVNATAKTATGSYTVVASSAGLPDASFSLTNTAGAPSVAAADSGSTPQSTVVNTAFPSPLSLTVRDAQGNPVSGVLVTFAVPASGSSAALSAMTATTDINGNVSVTATANTVAGASYQVSATVAGIASPVVYTLTNTFGAAVSMSITSGDAQSTVVNTAFADALTVHVADQFGNPVSGKSVTFAAPSGTTSATLSSTTVTTDANGDASVTATAGTGAGSYTVAAASVGLTTASFALTNTAGAPATATADASSTPQSTTVGTAFPNALVLTVRDSFGNPVSGTSVTFAPPSTGATATLSQTTLTTDADGKVTVTATASSTPGSYPITATVAGIAAPTEFAMTNVAGAPAHFDIVAGTPQSTVVATAFATALTVKITDALNNPLSGETVTFTAPSTGASAALGTVTVTTDANGEATTTATANQIAGAYTVTATSGTLAPLDFALTNTTDAPASITLDGGSSQSTVVNTAFADALGVTVKDQFGNPIVGADVTFTFPGTGASATLSATTATTDANGHVSVTAMANTIAGMFDVVATVTGLATPATFSLTNLAGAPAHFDVTGGNTQSAVVTHAFDDALAVRITDAFGNPIVGQTITFTAPADPSDPSATLSATTGTTDANGELSITATANTHAGTYDVVATSAGLSDLHFALTNEPGAAASIRIDGGNGQTAVVDEAFTDALALTVLDEFGNALSGVSLTFVTPSTGATAALSASTGTTDANGKLSITATAGSTSGAYQVNVSVDGTAVSATFALANVTSAPATITVVGDDHQSAEVDTSFADLVVLVSDANGNPVANANVTFHVPADGATAVITTLTVATDANGHATVPAKAGTRAGQYEVTATVSGVSTPATFTLTNEAGAPATITSAQLSSPQSAMVGTPFTNPLSVTVVDRFGNPVVGTEVTFTVPATGATAELTTVTVITDANGVASIPAKASSIAGSYVVTATAPGITTPATFSLTNLVGAPVTLSVVSGGTQHTPAGTAFGEPIVVEVLDALGNPVAGVTVTLTLPQTGASAVPSAVQVTTDANGVATFTLVANATAGAYEGVLSVVGADVPTVVSLANDTVPTVTELVADHATAGLGRNFVLTATVTSDVGVPTGTVRFLVDGELIDTVILDENGMATLTVDALVVGTRTVTAEYVPDVPFEASASSPVEITTVGGGISGGATCSASPASAGNAFDVTAVALVGLALVLLQRRLARR